MINKHILLICLFTSFYLLACHSCGSSSDSKAPLTGKQLYQKHCVTCHGAGGDLQLNGAKNLKLATQTVEERMQIVKYGRGLMAGLGRQMNNAEIERVAAYSMQLNPDLETPINEADSLQQ